MKKLLAVAMCLVMVLSMCVTAGAAGEPTTAANAVIVSNSTSEVEWSSRSAFDPDWYVVNSDVTIDKVTVTGDVNLLLVDGCTLTISNGITIDTWKTLSIYGQSNNTGKIDVSRPTGGQAAIAGQYGCIVVNGGTVIATGASGQKGISCDDITINGGIVRTTGGANASGIYASKLIANGGTVTATGVGDGSGVVGIYSNNRPDFNGGTVTAVGTQAFAYDRFPEFEDGATPTVKAGNDSSSASAVDLENNKDYYKSKWVQVVLPSKETPSPVYTISFDKNTGTGNMDVQVIKKDGSYTLPENKFTAPANKYFAGWGETAGSTTALTSPITIDGNKTFYAIWADVPTYTVNYAAGGGSGSMSAGTATQGVLFELPTCTFGAPTGMEFDKWDIGDGVKKAAGDKIQVTEAITVTATWKAKTYTVTYNAGTGASGSMTAGTATHGVAFTLPACTFTAPTGMEFDTWKIGDTSYPVGDGILPSANITVTATWKPKVDTPAAFVEKSATGDIVITIGEGASGLTAANLDKVYMNDTLVDSSNYTAEDGSIKLTLKKDYLNSLTNGDHTIKVTLKTGNYDGMECTTTLKVQAAGGTGGYVPPTSVIQSPKTFDAGVALYAGMALMSAAGAVYVTKKHH